MKKKVLSLLLALCMIVVPFTMAHAEDGVTEVSSAEELIKAFENAEDGDIVRLM